MKLVSVAALAVVTLMSGCAYNASPYGASVTNVDKIRTAKIRPVAVGSFTSIKPGLDSITCRAAGPVKVSPSFEGYIQKALVDELTLAAAYDPSSPNVITGRLETIDFSSGLSDASWTMALTVSNNKSKSFKVSSVFTFPGSFVADKACQEVAQNFSPAVQKLIADVVQNPEFAALAN